MNKDKLFNIIEMPTLKLMKYLNSAIKRKHYDIYTDDDNYIFAVPKKASNHIMLVSHMDTVKRPSKVLLSEKGGVLSNLNGVLGADDRAGVFANLEIADKCIKAGTPLPYLLFTNYEECGGLGVKQFCKDKITQHIEDDIFLMIELDRRGVNDAVYYSEPEATLKPIIESVGYTESWGSYSDVSTLSNYNDIAHVNLSIGYFNEHTKNEILVLSVVEYAIENVIELMPLITRKYEIDLMADKNWGKWGQWGTYNRGTTTTYTKDYTKAKDYRGQTKTKKKEEAPLALIGGVNLGRQWEKDEFGAWQEIDAKVCPNCMSFEGVIEYKGLGYNECEECGIWFDNEFNIIPATQADDDIVDYYLEKAYGQTK